ncbi:helix-turn-helix domain-containing protein [Quatrionicoccus australiensis]|uniref:helix-turn-helix domain-containing protein n=1 Tax=Quatrionicoccus australiensis TaxID=138118 RepID=UPI003850CF25
MTIRQPKLVFKTGEQARQLRKQLGMSQHEFWARVSVTQSGGSHYEAGRDIPKSVQYLLQIAFGSEKQFGELLDWLQRPDRKQLALLAQPTRGGTLSIKRPRPAGTATTSLSAAI